MATLYIAEFDAITAGHWQLVKLPPINEQIVNSWPGTSAAFNTATRLIRVHTDAICSIAIGASATTSNMRLAANQTEYFGVGGGETLSVVANT